VNPIRELFHAWERRLAFRDDPERRVLSFNWMDGLRIARFLAKHFRQKK
jgi:hypothetical protein